MSNQPDPYEILALALTGLEQVEEWTHEKGLTPADGWGSTTGLLRDAAANFPNAIGRATQHALALGGAHLSTIHPILHRLQDSGGAKFEQVQGVQLQGAQQDYVKRFKPDVETFRLALGILRND
jgi:hypothetical protein